MNYGKNRIEKKTIHTIITIKIVDKLTLLFVSHAMEIFNLISNERYNRLSVRTSWSVQPTLDPSELTRSSRCSECAAKQRYGTERNGNMT